MEDFTLNQELRDGSAVKSDCCSSCYFSIVEKRHNDKATYKGNILIGLTVSEGESMIITVGSMAAGEQAWSSR